MLVKASIGRAVMGKASTMSKKKTKASQVSLSKHRHRFLLHLQLDFNLQTSVTNISMHKLLYMEKFYALYNNLG